MKILAVPDPHGSDHWKAAAGRIDEFDKIIFLGDYFDSFVLSYSKQMRNFKNILAFAAANPEKVELCIGNHDLAYLTDQRCAGHQWEHETAIRKILRENLIRLNVVYRHGRWLFSHAGFSKLWMRENGLDVPEQANNLLSFKPQALEWVGPDAYGGNPNESPVWIRPYSLLMNAADGFNQCAGHTEMASLALPARISRDGKKFVFADTREHSTFQLIEAEDE